MPVSRVVRSDDAGATAILKNYLVKVDPTLVAADAAGRRGGLRHGRRPTAAGPATTARQTLRNWPGGTDLVQAAGDGSVAVAVNARPGAIGYVEPAAVTTLGLRYASVQSIKGKTFQQPLASDPERRPGERRPVEGRPAVRTRSAPGRRPGRRCPTARARSTSSAARRTRSRVS